MTARSGLPDRPSAQSQKVGAMLRPKGEACESKRTTRRHASPAAPAKHGTPPRVADGSRRSQRASRSIDARRTRQTEPGQGYEADLAYIHHVGFGGFATQAAPGVIEHLRQCGVRDGLVVDLGCGSGLLARELLDAGYDVLGVDSSASMIKLARANAASGAFRKQSYLEVPFPGDAPAPPPTHPARPLPRSAPSASLPTGHRGS